MTWLLAALLIALGAVPALADPLGFPACQAPTGDSGCVYYENGDSFSAYGVSQQGVGNISIVSPGLNGTAHAIRHRWPSPGQDVLISHSVGLTRSSGQKFWVGWYQRYDSNFRWAGDPGGNPPNSSHKEWDLRFNDGKRSYVANDATPRNGDFCNQDGFAAGLTGCPHVQFEADPEANPAASGHFYFLSDFVYQPGTTYHFILEITMGFKTGGPNGSSPGGFRMWANGTLVFSFTNVGTCANSNGTCTLNDLFIGGQHAGIGPGGNIIDYDEILITTTDISPGGGGGSSPPAAPTNLHFGAF